MYGTNIINKRKKMYNGRKELMNILSYSGFAKLCNVMKSFTELYHKFLKEGINFPLS